MMFSSKLTSVYLDKYFNFLDINQILFNVYFQHNCHTSFGFKTEKISIWIFMGKLVLEKKKRGEGGRGKEK